MWKRIFVGCVLFSLGLTVNLGDVSGQDKASAGVSAIISGENVGLLKTVAASELPNASAACPLNVLKVGEAKQSDGKPVPDLAGQLLYYLPTKTAESVMLGEKMQGRKITVSGTLFMMEHAVLVEKIETHKPVDLQDQEFEDIKVPKGTGVQAL